MKPLHLKRSHLTGGCRWTSPVAGKGGGGSTSIVPFFLEKEGFGDGGVIYCNAPTPNGRCVGATMAVGCFRLAGSSPPCGTQTPTPWVSGGLGWGCGVWGSARPSPDPHSRPRLYPTMQTAESVIADIEAEGFRLLTWEDLTQGQGGPTPVARHYASGTHSRLP